MKKLFALFLCLITIFAYTGCSSKTNPAPSNQSSTGGSASTAAYKDGIYTALGDKWKFGQEGADVTIAGGKITNIILRRLDTTGKEVNYNEWVGQKESNGQVKPNLKKYRLDMAQKMLNAQSPDVATISGATTSSNGWKTAVQRALDKAK